MMNEVGAVVRLSPPAMGVCRNPLQGMQPGDMHEVALLATLADLQPEAQGLLIVRCDGEWILPDDWPAVRALPGSVIEWYELPAEDDQLRTVLQIALLVVAWWNPGGWGAFIALVGNLAINALLPIIGPEALPNPATPYGTSLQGNRAALDEPVWKTFGRRRITPPFAAQPYMEFRPSVGTADLSDQYYYALFAVGEGNYAIERELIGNTRLASFADVLTHTYLPPGTPPASVLANVTTAIEVSGLVLESGRLVGGFAACAPRRTAAAIGVDVVATRGLGGLEGGSLTVTWLVEIREVDDFGGALSDWQVLAAESRRAATNTPQRWSNKYVISTPMRPEIRVQRTDVTNTTPGVAHEIAWVGLRAYLAQPAPLNPAVAHYEVVMRASAQLSAQTQNQFALIVRGLVRTRVAGAWGPEVETRNAAWHVLDIATSSVNGLGYGDERIDFTSFEELAAIADARQDHCDYTFTTSTDAWSAMQMLARTLRARVFKRGDVISIARDEWASLPVTAFTPRNTQPASMVVHEQLPTVQSFDGVILEYEDLRTWKWTPVECPSPGVSSMQRPLRKRIEGITGSMHATREGAYEAASMLWRRTTVSCTTELQGLLPAYMDTVRWLPELPGYGQSGDVVSWDTGGRVMGLSEPVEWGTSALYLAVLRDDGSCTQPVPVTPGPTAYDLVLPVPTADQPWFDPDFQQDVLEDGTRERPKYLLGPLAGCDEVVKIASIGDGGASDDGARLISIDGIVDDLRVHQADNAWLPGPGQIQDPVDGSGQTPPTPFTLIVDVDGREVYVGGNAGTNSAAGVTVSGLDPSWTLQLDMPAGLTYSGWSGWNTDSQPGAPPLPWSNAFRVTNAYGAELLFGVEEQFLEGQAAAAFVPATISGFSSYTFWIFETWTHGEPLNRGGLSIRLTNTF